MTTLVDPESGWSLQILYYIFSGVSRRTTLLFLDPINRWFRVASNRFPKKILHNYWTRKPDYTGTVLPGHRIR